MTGLKNKPCAKSAKGKERKKAKNNKLQLFESWQRRLVILTEDSDYIQTWTFGCGIRSSKNVVKKFFFLPLLLFLHRLDVGSYLQQDRRV